MMRVSFSLFRLFFALVSITFAHDALGSAKKSALDKTKSSPKKSPLSKKKPEKTLEKTSVLAPSPQAPTEEKVKDASAKTAPSTGSATTSSTTHPLASSHEKNADTEKTKLPLPRFISIKAKTAHMHVGPGKQFPIEWTFVRSGLPVEVLAEFEHWRKIRDSQGAVGWIHKTLLSGARFVLVEKNVAKLFEKNTPQSAVMATLAPGVIGRLLSCEGERCYVDVRGMRGWIDRTSVFGIYPHEQKIT